MTVTYRVLDRSHTDRGPRGYEDTGTGQVERGPVQGHTSEVGGVVGVRGTSRDPEYR